MYICVQKIDILFQLVKWGLMCRKLCCIESLYFVIVLFITIEYGIALLVVDNKCFT